MTRRGGVRHVGIWQFMACVRGSVWRSVASIAGNFVIGAHAAARTAREYMGLRDRPIQRQWLPMSAMLRKRSI